jgi:hypothetical protein
MSIPSRGATRWAGLILGALLVALLLAGWGVAGGRGGPGADVNVTVNRTGELAVEPLGTLISVRDLLPNRSADALFIVTNTTGTDRAVRLRARVHGADLDDQLALRITAWDRPLFSGKLGELRATTRRSLVLAPGAAVPLILRVWLPSRARAYRARTAEVTLELLSEAAT